ncbi:MAG: TlyA family rRNA (cytidine-2'-O)-methyltransferase [Candidatus Aminicenantes bacterium]|nr:MAG: TlyA family rRNA (cytidine-2'-O)-methyltransferase [Candidatus Aminicenantes bacterium]RLE05020.1 MAG: TlyA family rRNA (cytidine-2'-O)-methyltransferase [Candidatus Aminicenantes bacterium]HHF42276.1 TlyA family RNA methyltransferase [Candidatus Aminicenantes bacterium]
MKERADKLLVEQGLAPTRQKAQALIMAGRVFWEGGRVEKPGQQLKVGSRLAVQATLPFVSRGGLKLAEALDVFQMNVQGKIVADLGASTGGFTDCLLQRGARRVYAVDVDPRQLDWRLQQDVRVVPLRKNARYLDKDDFPEAIDLVTCDLSFISVLKVLPAIRRILGGHEVLALLKPQFEAGKKQVGKKGIIRDSTVHRKVLEAVLSQAWQAGFFPHGLHKCTQKGQKGNQEFFVFWKIDQIGFSWDKVLEIIKEIVRHEEN